MNSQTFTAFDKATGRVTYGGSSHAPELLENDDRGVLLGAVYTDGYLVGGVHHELPPQPSPNHTFNYTTKQWEDPRTLADLKAAQWNLIKSARSQAEYAGFTWDGSTFDSDAISQNRITGAVTLAQMSPTFVINWILADNTNLYPQVVLILDVKIFVIFIKIIGREQTKQCVITLKIN